MTQLDAFGQSMTVYGQVVHEYGMPGGLVTKTIAFGLRSKTKYPGTVVSTVLCNGVEPSKGCREKLSSVSLSLVAYAVFFFFSRALLCLFLMQSQKASTIVLQNS